MALSVAAGEVVCLLGPSGCGKTTVLRIVAGLERLQKGKVLLNGAVAADGRHELPPERRNVGFLFQDYALFPHLTVAENVGFGLQGLAASERRARVAEPLEPVVMADYGARYPTQRWGGTPTRGAAARAGPGTGAAVVGVPVTACRWFVNHRSAMVLVLAAGQFVTPGSCLGVIPAPAAVKAVSDFGPEGQVVVNLT